jgi:hypothetical protein
MIACFVLTDSGAWMLDDSGIHGGRFARYVALSGNESQFYKFYRMHNQQFVVWMSMNSGAHANSMK